MLVPYLRGFGPTRFVEPATPRSGEQAVLGADLLAFMDALHIRRPVLAGYDWGGRAACVVAALWPERCAGLVSFNSYNIQNIAKAMVPDKPENEPSLWYQYYFHNERGRAGLEADRRGICRLLWKMWSPTWPFDDATFERSAVAFDNPDFVEVVIHSYRHRYGLVAGDPACADIERRLAAQPVITVPDDHLRRPRRRRATAGRCLGPCAPVFRTALAPAGAGRRPQHATGSAAGVCRCGARTRAAPRKKDMTPSIRTRSEHRCFGGVQRFHEHDSRETGLPMRFSTFLPPQAEHGPVPALLYLAGLTCTEETFMVKAGAQRLAAELGMALVAPDTSPRGANLPGESAAWDFGLAAGFYLDATQAPWSRHYRMESWLVGELLPLLNTELPLQPARWGIFGHSMGGHGALTLALRHPGVFRSVSAFAPICAPSECPWGHKAFAGYLGTDLSAWSAHDASALMAAQSAAPFPGGILIDQGLADAFLDVQLLPHRFEAACAQVHQPLTLRRHAGYDHGYYFIASFMADHLAHHHRGLTS